MRECCETKRESGARTEGCVTKIEEVDDVMCEELEEWESMKERKSSERGRSCASTIQSSTEQEQNEHEMTHLPSHSWCRQCIMGRRREEGCRMRKASDGERHVLEIHLDCMFMGDGMEGKTLAFLVARERMTKTVFSIVVPRMSTGRMDMLEVVGMTS